MAPNTDSTIFLKPFVKGVSRDNRVVIRLENAPIYLCLTLEEYGVMESLINEETSVADYLSMHLEGKQGLTFKAAIDLLLKLDLHQFLDRAPENALSKLKELTTPPTSRSTRWIHRLWDKVSHVLDVPVIQFETRGVYSILAQSGRGLLSLPAFILLALTTLYWMRTAPAMFQFGTTVIKELVANPESLLIKLSIAFSVALTTLSLIQVALLSGAGATLYQSSLNASTFFCVLRWHINDDDAFMVTDKRMMRYRILSLLLPWLFSMGIWNVIEARMHSHIGGVFCITYAAIGVFTLCPFFRSSLIRLIEGTWAYLQLLEPTGIIFTKKMFRKGFFYGNTYEAGQGRLQLPRGWIVLFLSLGIVWTALFSFLFVGTLNETLRHLWPALTNYKKIGACLSALLILWTFVSSFVFPVAKVLFVIARNVARIAYRPWQEVRRRHSLAEAKKGSEAEGFTFLKSIPLFSHFSDDRIRSLSGRLRVLPFKEGQDIIREGDDGKEFFILVSGQAKVIFEREDGLDEVEDFLQPGDSFGEISLIENVKRTATVRATTPVITLVLQRKEFDETFPEGGRERQELTVFLRRAKLVLDSPVFSHLSPNQIRELLKHVESEHYNANEYLIKQGAIGDSVYLIEEGRVKVEQEGKSHSIATLDRGKVLGAISILRGVTRTASAIALTDVQCLRISKAQFLRVCVANIIVAQLVSDLSESQLAALKAG